MNTPRFATLVLRLDAAANVLLAAVLVVAASWLAEAAGLARAWPLVIVGLVIAVNGVLCWQAAVAGSPAPAALLRLAAVDGLFAVGVVVIALTDPTGAALWLRWALAALGAVVADVGAIKLLVALRQHRDAGAAGVPALR